MNGEGNGSNTAVIVRPHAGALVGVAAEQQRSIAEIQAALTVAKASPRNEMVCVDRIKNACQRQGLAEKAEYVYSRGGTDITGPTIDLLTVIANCWGNLQFGFRELLQSDGESTVETFAWDLETNTRRVVVFTVPHKRVTKTKTTTLTDPRDVYELIANNAQRRVRACLEAVIPPDVVEDALNQCRETLKAKAEVTPASIQQMLTAFGPLGVTQQMIEKRLGRRLDAMQPAQLVNLRKVYKSLTDGMSKVGDWFEEERVAASAVDAAKEALRAGGANAAPATPPAAAATAAAEPAQPAVPEPEKPQLAAPPAGTTKATKAQQKRLADLRKQLGLSVAQLDARLVGFGVPTANDLSEVQAGELLAQLEAEAGQREPGSDG